jgi:hypothetical protein
VHGLSALWISGRLSERIVGRDPQALAAAVSALFVEAVLAPPGPGDGAGHAAPGPGSSGRSVPAPGSAGLVTDTAV